MGATRKKELMDEIFICESLLNRKTTDSFLKRMVTNDEKEVQQKELHIESDSSEVRKLAWKIIQLIVQI